jgi:glycosyltransferase involved in cell wall biosynthesis
MRITLLNTMYPPYQVGGAEVSVSLLAEALARAGDDVTVLTLHPEPEEVCEMRNGVRVYRLPLDNFYWGYGERKRSSALARLFWHCRDRWNLKAAARVGRLLEELKPDVVHTNNISGFSISVWEAVKKQGIRLVHTLRDYYMLCPRAAMFREGKFCDPRCLRCRSWTAYRREWSATVDTVVSVSEFVLGCHQKNQFFQGVDSTVIYNILPATGSQIRERKAEEQVFGYVGALKVEKGIEVALRATKLLKRPNWRLRIAGTGLDSYVARLKAKYNDPRIEWLGFTNSQKFYQSVDVVVLPSVWPEPLSRVAIEAFSNGCGLICAESGGMPEIARMGKVVGLYPAKDASALAEIMNEALTDTNRWRSGGWLDASAMKAFTEEAVTSRYRAVYRGDRKS